MVNPASSLVVLPFFALAAAGWGALAYATGSIIVGVFFHVLVDAPGWLWLVDVPESARDLMGAGVADGSASTTLMLWIAGLILSTILTAWSMGRLAVMPGAPSASSGL